MAGGLLDGEIAVVTGAGQGIGRAIALAMAQHGADVAIGDLDAENAQATAREIEGLGRRAWATGMDVTDTDAVAAFAGGVEASLGAASVLVNNAGRLARCGIDDADFVESWDAAMRTNVTGTRDVTRAFLGQLRSRGGRIVNLASIRSTTVMEGGIAYSVSKGAVAQMTRGMANDLAADGIRVNAVAPGLISTPMTAMTEADPAAIGSFLTHVPMGRAGRPEEVANAVVFLASSMSSFVTGAILPVDGGYLVR